MPDHLARQSVLDRILRTDLLYEGAGDRGRKPRGWDESVGLLKRNLLRDLQWLLNTRRTSDDELEAHPHLRRSVYNFGLEDITTFSADSSETPAELRRTIETTIERFEPRLTDVRVTLVDPGESGQRRIRFLVEGSLRTDPDPERVEFDTVLEITSKRFEVSSRRSHA